MEIIIAAVVVVLVVFGTMLILLIKANRRAAVETSLRKGLEDARRRKQTAEAFLENLVAVIDEKEWVRLMLDRNPSLRELGITDRASALRVLRDEPGEDG